MMKLSINKTREFANMKLCAECMEPIKNSAYLCEYCLKLVNQ